MKGGRGVGGGEGGGLPGSPNRYSKKPKSYFTLRAVIKMYAHAHTHTSEVEHERLVSLLGVFNYRLHAF